MGLYKALSAKSRLHFLLSVNLVLNSSLRNIICLFGLVFVFLLFRATPKASVSSHSSQQCWILNPLSEARDRTCVLMDTSRIHFHWATTGTPLAWILKEELGVYQANKE